MNPAPLLPRNNEIGPITARSLLLHATAEATCIIARRGLMAEGLLTSVEEETLELDVYGGAYRTAWLTPANPFVSALRLEKLDGQGVVRPGIGGWPLWLQPPESYAPLVAQIMSNEEAEMSFGDDGSFYIFAREEGGFDVVFQQY